MGFFKCNCLDLIEKQNKIISQLMETQKSFDLEMERLKSHIISLRGLVNRRLSGGEETQKIEEKPKEENIKEETKSINSITYY